MASCVAHGPDEGGMNYVPEGTARNAIAVDVEAAEAVERSRALSSTQV